MRLHIAFATFVFFIKICSTGADPVQPLRQDLLKSLTVDKYFKNTSCREFADYNLSKNGLPKIGDLGPVRGVRLATDRQSELADPPRFMDSVQSSEKPYSSYKISATGSKTEWHMVVEREVELPETGTTHPHMKTRTAYNFRILDYANKGSCAVVGFDFLATHDGTSASIKKKMDLDSCMNLFIEGMPKLTDISPAEYKAIKFLQEDCSMSMRYSLEAKKILATSTH
jgi:hypothetical protein